MMVCFGKWKKENERYDDVRFEEEGDNNDWNVDYVWSRKDYGWLK